MHNVLKGIRILSPTAADRLMQALDLTVPEVLWSAGGNDASGIRAIPLLQQRIGPGTASSFQVFQGFMPFPYRLVAALEEPLAAYLAADLALPGDFRAGDLILMDQSRARRAVPDAASCWVVAQSAGLRVRYVRRTRGGLEITSYPGLAWQSIPLPSGGILEIVRARIVWIGREMEKPAGPFGSSGAGD